MLRRCAPGAGFTPLPAWRNAPHIFFCLDKRKRAAPGTKENRSFSGLLVRPVKTGLVSSSCAEPLALPVRLRRSCPVSNNLLVQIGLLSATAPLPLRGQKKSAFAPAGRRILRMPSLAEAAQGGPRVLFAPSGLHPMLQLRPKRSGRAGQ